MDISIIIVNYKTPELCEQCIDSIHNSLQNESLSYEIILVDNHSDDGSFQRLKLMEDGHTHIFETERNGGFGYGNNKGFEKSKGEYLFFLNSDTILYPETLARMWEYAKEHQNIGAIGCLMEDGDRMPLVASHAFEDTRTLFLQTIIKPLVPNRIRRLRGELYTQHRQSQITECDWVAGAAMLIPRRVFEEVGGWNEKFFMYMEDEELCFRIRKAGYSVMVYPALGLQHLVGRSGGSKFVAFEKYKSAKIYFRTTQKRNSRLVNGLLYIQCWRYLRKFGISERIDVIKRLMKE